MTCLLLRQALKTILPHAHVETAQNGAEAMRLIEVETSKEINDEKYTRADIPTHGFDIIIIGGHLIAPCNSNNQNCDKNPFPTSGSQLLHGG
jgi:hydroxymethylpyrimidine/phosphomethylpyrimidine kinase